MASDPYKELGVSKGASADEVKKAYRKLAKELHPDKNPGDKITEDKFKRVTAAFDILGDKEKRAKYDAGQIDGDGNEQHRGFGGGGRAGGSPFDAASLSRSYAVPVERVRQIIIRNGGSHA